MDVYLPVTRIRHALLNFNNMNSISNAVLTISHDHARKTAKVKVTCKVNFGSVEYTLMRNNPGNWFKLKCILMGADSGFNGADDHLYTIPQIFYFPDATGTQSEVRNFEVTVGEGLLDEDWGTDEIYARLELVPLVFGTIAKRNTNTVSHSF